MTRKSILAVMATLLGLSNVVLGGTILAWDCNCIIDPHGEPRDPLCCVPQGNDFVAIAVYGWHAIALQQDGSLVGWGRNHYGQCGVPDGNDFVKVGAGGGHSVALKSDGTVVAWGLNYHGQCDVPDGNDFVDIAAGAVTNVALTSEGSLVEWGYHYTPPCDPNYPNECDPNAGAVPEGSDFVDVAVGEGFCLALRSDRSIVAWGQNIYGECNVP